MKGVNKTYMATPTSPSAFDPSCQRLYRPFMDLDDFAEGVLPQRSCQKHKEATPTGRPYRSPMIKLLRLVQGDRL